MIPNRVGFFGIDTGRAKNGSGKPARRLPALARPARVVVRARPLRPLAPAAECERKAAEPPRGSWGVARRNDATEPTLLLSGRRPPKVDTSVHAPHRL